MNLLKLCTILFFTTSLFAQDVKLHKELPRDLTRDNNMQHSYNFTTDYFDYDLLGHFKSKKRLVGTYTIGLGNNKVRWNNVRTAQCDKENGEYLNWKKSKFMDDFTYIPSSDIVNSSFFAEIPEADIQHKNLIWDMAGLEHFTYSYWDSLKLNQTFYAHESNGSVNLADEGTFENKDIRLTYIGVTEINNQPCAIIKYATMNNPLNIKNDNLTLTGRSHYWGEIYVSLIDKQIEYATMSEDVITDVKIPGLPQNIMGYTVRNIILEKNN